MAEPVDPPILRGELRDADLHTQIDALSLALQDWRRTREQSQTPEERLVQITFECARMVESWQQMERGRAAVAGRDGRRDAVDRLHQATGERLRALERHIEHEWDSLPDGRNHPGRHAGAQLANRNGDGSASLTGLAGVESRLAGLEQDLQAGMAQLSRELQTVVAELRNARPPRPGGANPAFPLESVMRIHEELREADATGEPRPEALPPASARALPPAAEVSTALAARVESLERAVAVAAETAPQPRRRWWPLLLVAGLAAAVAGLGLYGAWLQRRVDERLNAAAVRVAEAERQRDTTVAATREDAAREVADARQSAAQAQVVGNVLAAPDLLRYSLIGGEANARAFGQVLFSRSRGMVFSASRLPPAGEGRTYQLWLLPRVGAPVSAGLIAPDSAGRVTLATDAPPPVTGRLVSALVTLERAGGASEPSADRVLIRVE